MSKALEFGFRITADTAQGRAALAQFEQQMRQVGAGSGKALDPFTQSVAKATGGAQGLTTALRPLQTALGSIGVGVTAAQLIQMADAYGQMTARLRLATQYTGDFAEVQKLLKQAANDTRAPLQETVQLYTSLAPSLASLGRTGAEAVGVVTTVNQAIALSGASSGAAQAALVQFGQALASGTLRGEELNSIMEQTPALAQAIADGLGVSRGALRQMGQEGRLSAEEVVKALEKVSGAIAKDFASLPLTVGQAMTILQNQLFELVGSAGQGSGAMDGLARAIVFVAEGLKTMADSGDDFRPFVEFIMDAVDGVARVVRILATGIAGYAAAIDQLLSGNLTGAVEIYKQIGAEVEKILLEPVAADKRVAQVKRDADARLKIETDLATEIKRLEDMRAVAAGKANADILLDDKALQKKRIEEARKTTEEQVKGTERLRDALRNAWEGAIDGARRAKEEAAALMQQAANAQQAGADKALDRRMKGMTPEERDATARREADTLTRDASISAASAMLAASRGDIKAAEKLAAEAAKQAERAEKFADMVADDDTAARLLEQLGEIRAEALRAEARAKEAQAQAQSEQATAIQQQIQTAEQRLVALKAELAKPVSIQLDITAAEQRIKTLQDQLARLGGSGPQQAGEAAPGAAPGLPEQKQVEVTAETTAADQALQETADAVANIPNEKTVVITTVTSTGGTTFSDAASAWNAEQNLPGRAFGGPLPGRALHDRSDNVIYRGTPGEWVIQRPAVRYWGADFLAAINNMRLPKFAYGGQLGGALNQAMADSGAGGSTPVVLDFGQLGRYDTNAQADVADQLVRVFQRAALQRGRR